LGWRQRGKRIYTVKGYLFKLEQEEVPKKKRESRKIIKIRKLTRFDTRNPFVDGEGLAVMSQQPRAATNFYYAFFFFSVHPKNNEKKKMGLAQIRRRCHRVNK